MIRKIKEWIKEFKSLVRLQDDLIDWFIKLPYEDKMSLFSYQSNLDKQDQLAMRFGK